MHAKPVAWRVRHLEFRNDAGIYFATTRAKAKYKAWMSARESGFPVTFGEFHVERAETYDDLAQRFRSRCGGILESCIAALSKGER